jgi:hypothetical protein
LVFTHIVFDNVSQLSYYRCRYIKETVLINMQEENMQEPRLHIWISANSSSKTIKYTGWTEKQNHKNVTFLSKWSSNRVIPNGIISAISIYRYMLLGINVVYHYYTYIMFKTMQISQYSIVTVSCCMTILMYYDVYFCNFSVYKYKELSTLRIWVILATSIPLGFLIDVGYEWQTRIS